ncbi:anti-sigma factor [Enterococcus faecalis]|uniref:anti-sigma factor n=1 Tax=Enterococcus faecalis TaxID=1351 RepID=UPI00045358D0|nr:anti-sigma factor [Enterococcus faecalis]ETT89877.1 hypothetical protein P000_02442 [Enterococcus faecalis EnGen0400]MBB6708726.1 anti-sigma factor [Enterococcus faecalis]MCD5048771.1 anti-sigma factor [Enterococcus faecalis]MDN3123007.1 anti-sigma factor [Enterococcus faecalis]OXC93602.1 hypothetical protein CBL16_10950 [Enterococcus faecalis]
MDLKKSIRKAKRKQFIVIGAITVVSFAVLFVGFFVGMDKLSTKNYHTLLEVINDQEMIASPNTQLDSQVIANSSPFGGEVVTHRSKNIDGYTVEWSNLRSRYSFFRNSIDRNEAYLGSYYSSKNSYEYNRQTKQKVATFYNPAITNYYDDVKNELSELDKMENQVAEVAISFDKPYPYEEVRKMLPSNVNLVWLYVYSETVNEKGGPSGTLPYGFQLSMDDHNEIFDPENDKQHFFETLEKFPLFADNQEGQKFIQQNKNKKVEKLPIWGVMLTGQTKNFKALQNEPFVRGASIGVTAPIVPYIQPEK